MKMGKEFFCKVLDETTSTQDAAFTMAKKNGLPVWGSVLALKQTEGRGQLRRHWEGLEGNLMVSLRLPDNPLFTSQHVAVVTSTLIAVALRRMSFKVYLKWPNDLAIIKDNIPCKIAGILLEERNNIIIAGIGINLVGAPPVEDLDTRAKLIPGFLLKKTASPPTVFWQNLFILMYQIFNNCLFPRFWKSVANYILFANGKKVTFKTSDEKVNAILKGINNQGEILLLTNNGIRAFSSGELEFS